MLGSPETSQPGKKNFLQRSAKNWARNPHGNYFFSSVGCGVETEGTGKTVIEAASGAGWSVGTELTGGRTVCASIVGTLARIFSTEPLILGAIDSSFIFASRRFL